MRKNLSKTSQCVCGSSQKYIKCCGQYLRQGMLPLTAETLMRSRYSAYVLEDEAYLLSTWHSSTCPTALNLQQERIEWTKLDILTTRAGRAVDNTGSVEFIAHYYIADGLAAADKQQLHEVSQFVKENDQWFYVDGLID